MRERKESMAGAVRGRIVVSILILLGVAGTIGSALYRRHARMRYAAELDAGEAERLRAFHGLLQMNGLWSLARDYVYIPERAASSSPSGSNYLRAGDGGGGTLHVVRAVEEEKAAQAAKGERGGGESGAIFVFEPSGRILHVVKGARAFPLPGGAGGPAAALVVEGEEDGVKHSTVMLVGKALEQALRVRGRFIIETLGGPVDPGAAAEGAGAAAASELPIFRYEPATRSFHGPAGGPGEAWEVDRGASLGYSP